MILAVTVGLIKKNSLNNRRFLITLLLLLLLSCFSRVRLCATPETATHQAPPSQGFSRQEHWSGLPFPSPKRESEVTELCATLSDPMDCSPPGSSIHGIFQARVLEWGAIAFSNTQLRQIFIYFTTHMKLEDFVTPALISKHKVYRTVF